MKISYSYRGVHTEIENSFTRISSSSEKGCVKLHSSRWSDSSKKRFTATIEPHELLSTAEACLKQLNLIARTNYKIMSINHEKK
jgi:hypothetical protein